MPWDVVSVGPVTRRMASNTLTSSSFEAFLPTTVWLGTCTWIERPDITSSVRTQRHKAPRLGVSFLMRISARRIIASVYLPSVSAAEMRPVRLLFSVDA